MFTEKILKTIIERAEAVRAEKGGCLLAIDGRCGSGKTTLAAELAERLDCPVIAMDDFFLRPEQRTPERYAEPGGNVDRERFLQEVLIPLHEGHDAVYRVFDCQILALTDTVTVPRNQVVIIEGSYACHPELRPYYDLTVFLDIDPEEQLERIRRRSGEEKLEAFRSRWIPLEELYFRNMAVAEHCDLVFNVSEE
ncbi:MAG: AAA family ATPase [Solobacterium sp.]|nr:AAA family ATPase [Solobacterium sp.]